MLGSKTSLLRVPLHLRTTSPVAIQLGRCRRKPDAEAEQERELSSMKTRLEQLARPVIGHSYHSAGAMLSTLHFNPELMGKAA